MKRISAILLLLLLIAPFVAGYWSLKHQIHIHKKQVKRTLAKQAPSDELEVFTFSKQEAADLDWKHSKEFRYKGEMYDVVRKLEKEDSITYWCWWDSEETMLYRKLAGVWNNLNNQDPFQNHTKRQLVSLWNSLFLDTYGLMPTNFFAVVITNFQTTKDGLKHQYYPPESPPPQWVI